jgi:succinyl-diaminopimelate desuccinylase
MIADMTDEAKLAQSLVRIFSPSGAESPATSRLVSAFRDLGFDEAYLDEAGNAVGIIRAGEGPTLMLNGHLDTVPLGDEDEWSHPPLSGNVSAGRLWGRGSCDMKSAVACMTYGAVDARRRGVQGTLIVTGVVLEEVGGLGSYHVAETLRPDVVILGEPSKLSLKLGHRGRVELHGSVPGQNAHAARAELGANAVTRAAAFLTKLEDVVLPQGGPLQGSSVTPTRIVSFPEDSTNVVPGSAKVTLDYRNIPGDDPEDIMKRIQELDDGIYWSIPVAESVTENGRVRHRTSTMVSSYLAPSENKAVNLAREIIKIGVSRSGVEFREGVWWFCTDAPQLSRFGAPVIGFGPGEEELAHTSRESVPLDHLPVARRVYADLACSLLAET